MKRLLMGTALAVVAVATAAAQTQSIYGRDGKFQGSAIARGNSTSFYNRNGHFDGSAIRNGKGIILAMPRMTRRRTKSLLRR
jgi:hypothetical protein